eukprot:TRINITY_DN6313_c0_g1_i3.p1 TRINITY_DN6313_c0_g1~~TRINITY_DN6313_c0_g1_i3.p1  ORF type:complete len:119 (-),score=10.01 TRINITY_DN6313_c0_g1_i3:2186-2542(-)
MSVYTTSLLECHKHIDSCLITCFCPFVQNAYNKAALEGEQCTIFHCICCPSAYINRREISNRYHINSSAILDCLSVCICYHCTVCQDAREIRNRQSIGAERKAFVAKPQSGFHSLQMR